MTAPITDRTFTHVHIQTILRRVAAVCGAGVILIALLGLLGWAGNVMRLASFHAGDKPIAPCVAVLLLPLGLLLLRWEWLARRRLARGITLSLLLVTALFGGLEFLQGFGVPVWDVEGWFFTHLPRLASPQAETSPVAGFLKLLSVPRAPKESPVSALIRNTGEVEDWKLFLT